jgi:Flp pilus assembly protein TadG
MAFLRNFLRNRGGASALEFAIVAPILAGVLVSGFDAWVEINRKQDMHAAVQAGVHYYMGGGTDDTVGQSVSISGWPNKPGDGQVSLARACTCGGAATSCNVVCAITQQAPETRVTLTATTQWNGLHPAALTESETVRVR